MKGRSPPYPAHRRQVLRLLLCPPLQQLHRYSLQGLCLPYPPSLLLPAPSSPARPQTSMGPSKELRWLDGGDKEMVDYSFTPSP